MHHRAWLAALALLVMTAAHAPIASATQAQTERDQKPVKEIASGRVAVGSATFPLYLSADWSNPLPEVTARSWCCTACCAMPTIISARR